MSRRFKLVLTGFSPFDGEKLNPSWEAVKGAKLAGENLEVLKVQIPTAYEESTAKIREIIDREKPDLLLEFGQAGGISAIQVERVGINIRDSKTKDNAGYLAEDEKILAEAANAYFSTIPIKKVVKDLRANNIPAYISNSAGTFVCNNLLYSSLAYIEEQNLDCQVGFIHLPYLPEQVLERPNLASMSLEEMQRAIEIIVGVLYVG